MSRIHRLKCDGCGVEEDLEKKPVKIPKKNTSLPGIVSTTKKDAVRFKLPSGWKKIDGRDVCSECAEKVEQVIGESNDE